MNRYWHTDVMCAISASLTDDLRKSKYRGSENYLAGHCYVATEALYHILGGKEAGYKPMFIKHEGEPHWFLSNGKSIYDITCSQFQNPVMHKNANGKGFLTRHPSKRAKIVIKRAKEILKGLDERNRL